MFKASPNQGKVFNASPSSSLTSSAESEPEDLLSLERSKAPQVIIRKSLGVIGVACIIIVIMAATSPLTSTRQTTPFREPEALERAVLGESVSFSEVKMSAPKLVIHFVRHAEVHNPEDVKYGRLSGFKLSAEGLLNAQGPGAERLAKARQNVQDALHVNKTSGWFVSPMLRTRQTAAAVAAGQPDFKEINSELFMGSVVDSQLNEVLVPHQGKKYNPSIDYFARDEVNHPGEGFETFVDVLRRMQSFVKGLLHDPNHIGTQVVAVSHAECILAVRLWASNATEKVLAAYPTIPESHGVEKPGFVSVTTVVFPYERPMDNLKWLQ